VSRKDLVSEPLRRSCRHIAARELRLTPEDIALFVDEADCNGDGARSIDRSRSIDRDVPPQNDKPSIDANLKEDDLSL